MTALRVAILGDGAVGQCNGLVVFELPSDLVKVWGSTRTSAGVRLEIMIIFNTQIIDF